MKGANGMETEARKAWTKANTVFIGVKLQKSTAADILQYLEGKQNQTEIKKALRLLIETERKEQEQG
jgi:hypothetical protein